MHRRKRYAIARVLPARLLAAALVLSVCGSALAEDEAAIAQANSLSRAFRSAARAVVPTVVTVRTTTKPRAISPRSHGRNPFEGTPFEDFFGDDFPGFGGVPSPESGMGSGVIIDPSGVVLTNNHVVEKADKITVELSDGRRFDVVDVKVDPDTDLAVLRIKVGEPLPAAKLGDSNALEIGDWVIAVGNPFGLEQTVSAGIISAKGRSLDSVRRGQFLQTDAAINPGNSGGPLVNLAGEVVGINTAIFSRSGGYQGIGFAIPINVAKWVTPQLVKSGSVQRAYLGVAIEPITAERAEELGVRPNQGVVVRQVYEGAPAAAAGLKRNDVILDFDGRPIHKVSDLQAIVERSTASSAHKLQVLRDGKPLTLEVKVESMPEHFGLAKGPMGGSSEFYNDRQLGLVVIEMSDYWAERLGYKDTDGALIMHVDRSRIAARAGLRDGMLIRRINDRSIHGVEDFKAAIKAASLEQGIELQVQTPKGSQTIVLKSS